MARFYKMLDHISDAYVEVKGQSLEECFSKAGLAVVDLMVDLDTISEVSSRKFEAKGFDIQSLLYNFLEQVLIGTTSEEFLIHSLRVKISKTDDSYAIMGFGKGEQLSKGRHKPKLEVKAITYHRMEITESGKGVVVRFLLDL